VLRRRGRQPRRDDRARVDDEIASPATAAAAVPVGISLGTYTGIADDEHERRNVPRAFYVSPHRIMEARADGGMQNVGEVLDEHNLPTGRREHRRVRACARQERRKGIQSIGYGHANSVNKKTKNGRTYTSRARLKR